MTSDTSRHLDEELAERYSLGDIPEEQKDLIDEHLLLCENCRNQVTAADEYVRPMQRAARIFRERPRLREVPRRRRAWIPVLIAAAAVLAVAFLIAARLPRRPTFTVTLTAMRGDLTAHAPAGAPLAFRPDLTGLPLSKSYRLEMVNARGARVWRGAFPGATAAPPQSEGTYFIRVVSAGGEALREYALSVEQPEAKPEHDRHPLE